MTRLRPAEPGDVGAICRFGEKHIPPHYTPLIGDAAAHRQVRRWWNESHIGAAVMEGRVVVADNDGHIVAVGQRGADHVVYKLYLHPEHRGRGLGRRLLDALASQLPASVDKLRIEHFAANERAGAFYEREGFAVERIEPDPSGDPALAVVWRARPITVREEWPRPPALG
ncbi:GNAT family N-acetyltransferase [Amycolatopsis rubida]|uniref:GNAT family N-acetyltransferase n=1 Tax=Amycolatopsis rubida TaxID=112413 RepID=A0ABX0BYP2_9PSEU|nr:GNAT family N-acetyltransferase [Amycolatopsis sp. M39]MYW95716.1 GNAT family N-acetyltransferase [Amycolatopsis rubida]NEC60705.1 GNAT family N-acetyltransferase [Amycolatopsis rubida]OAP22345.1 putative acetyltransferase [Amycolatopsis sp. M39]